MAAHDVTIPCPFCGDDVGIVLGPDPFVGEAWSGICPCGGSYSCGPDGSPGFGSWSPPDPALDIEEPDGRTMRERIEGGPR